jgi:hypothetical protein
MRKEFTMRTLLRVVLVSALAAVWACTSTTTKTAPGPSRPGPGSSGGSTGQPPGGTATAPPATAVPAPAPTVPPPAPAPAALEPTTVSASAAVPPPAASVPAQPAASMAPARPYQDVLKLKQAGLSDDFILNKVRTEGVNYGLTTSEILELRSAGLSEAVLGEMMRSGQSASTTAGAAIARKADFSGLARVGHGFMGLGTSTKNVGRLVVEGDTITFSGAADPDKNFSIYAKNVKEFFNTCVLRPNQNLCLEVGFVTYTGDEYRFRDPGWKNGENRLVTEVSNYFRQAFPNLFFSQRTVNEL